MTMVKDRKLVIVGASSSAEVFWEYFETDSRYEVVAFAVEQAFLQSDRFRDRPVVALERLAEVYPPETHDVFVSVVYTQLNRARTRLLSLVRQAGYRPASYISSRAFIAPSAKIGEHCVILENSTVQPFVTIGDNVVLWSANHIGHHSVVRDNVFMAGHVGVGSFCEIGANSFLGGKCAISNSVKVAQDCWVGLNVPIQQDTKAGEIYQAPKVIPSKVSALRFFRVKDT